MVDEIKPHIIGITESWANNDAELGLEGYVMFRKDRMGRRGGGVLLYIKETIPAYEVQLQEEADCKEAIWRKLVTGHTGPFHGKSSQVEKNKLSNSAMKTSIYYFCIASLICSKILLRKQ